jgi:hypothetical protein
LWVANAVEDKHLAPEEADQISAALNARLTWSGGESPLSEDVRDLLVEGGHYHHAGYDLSPSSQEIRRLAGGILRDNHPWKVNNEPDSMRAQRGESQTWKLWSPGEVLKSVSGIEPLLASWESKTHPAQIRLQAYLDHLVTQLGALPDRRDLFLVLAIDVRDPARLLRHYDLENYVTPVVYRFGAEHFNLCVATKQAGGGSTITVGVAEPRPNPTGGWAHFECQAGSGTGYARWKQQLRENLLATQPTVLPPGPVEVELAWRCASSRNWTSLWKPTGDAMGPVLGEPDSRNPYNPNDDRIVSLKLHRNIDETIWHDVDVAKW